MTSESTQLDPVISAKWYADYAIGLKAFLLGVLKNPTEAEEVCQVTFAKALTHGGTVQVGKEKAWLFQVAFNEAMSFKRKSGVSERAHRELFNRKFQKSSEDPFPFEDHLIKAETADRVRSALHLLSAEQQQIVQLRIDDNKTFQEIADQLDQPLGTVLTRMRLALQKLREALKNEAH